MPIRTFELDAESEIIRRVQTHLRDLGFEIDSDELAARRFGAATRRAISEFQENNELRRTEDFDASTRAALERALAEAGSSAPALPRIVEGRILLDVGLPADEVEVRVYQRHYGGVDSLLGTATTDAQGRYRLAYDFEDGVRNIELRAVNNAGVEVPLSSTLYDPGGAQSLDGVTSGDGFSRGIGEYSRLVQDVQGAPTGGPPLDLGAVREDDERQDLTLLHHATGWDARLIAVAAEATARTQETQIPAEALYGLFRAGLPRDRELLATVSVESFEAALEAADRARIVDLDAAQRTAAREAFEGVVREEGRKWRFAGSRTTLGQLLDATDLSSTEQRTFEDLLLVERKDGAELWEELGRQLDPDKVDDVRVTGMLADLTGQNLELVADLRTDVRSPDDLKRLVDAGLDKADAWRRKLEGLASGEEDLARLIPPVFEDAGETTAERLEVYAHEMAYHVRSRFPTRMLVKMLEERVSGARELDLGEDQEAVRSFLAAAEGLDFQLGRDAVKPFVEKEGNREHLSDALGADQLEAGIEGTQRLHRNFQLSQGPEVLSTAVELGFDSALKVLAWSYREFIDRFAQAFGSPAAATSFYRRAQQIGAVTYNFLTAARQIGSMPPLYALSAPVEKQEQARLALAERFPQLRSLFGSLDFCECEHCGSVLSPAAYFVDLLRFLDPADPVWESFRTAWNTSHGEPYPWRKPYEELAGRRPDLPHLRLTCENTHTTLPAIDLINEILEYEVARGSLDAAAAHDTGDVTSEDALAEPQNVLREAYEELRHARHGLGLPFDRPLAMVRAFSEHLGTSLTRLMETLGPLRSLQGLLSSGVSTRYLRAASWFESLGLAYAEVRLFTAGPAWYELYGFSGESGESREETEARAIAELTSAKTLARLLKVSYRELDALVGCAFLDPRPDRRLLLAPDAGCDFERTTLGYAGDAAPVAVEAFDLLRLHLLVRLWRKLGWDLDETDHALTASVPTDLWPLTPDNRGEALRSSLINIARMARLDQRLRLGKDGRRQLLNLGLPLAGSEPADTADDLRRLLARGLRLSVADVESFEQLSGIRPLDGLAQGPGTRPADDQAWEVTLRFVETVETVREGDFSIGELGYLLRHQEHEEGLDQAQAQRYERFRDSFTARLEFAEKDEAVRQVAVDVLSTELEAEPELIKALVARPLLIRQPVERLPGELDAVEPEGEEEVPDSLLDDLLAAVGEATVGTDTVGTDSVGTDSVGTDSVGTDTVGTDTVGTDSVGTDSVSTDTVASDTVGTDTVGTDSVGTDSVGTDSVGTDTVASDTVASDAGLRAFVLLNKIVRLAQGLGLGPGEVLHFQTYGDDFDGFDWHAFPAHAEDRDDAEHPAHDTPRLFHGIVRLLAYARLKQDMPLDGDDLVGLFAEAHLQFDTGGDPGPILTPWLNRLAAAFASQVNRPPGQISQLVQRMRLGGVQGLDSHWRLRAFVDERGLGRLWRALQAIDQLGGTLEQVGQWVTPRPTFEAAESFAQAVRARYDREAWHRVAPSIFDPLRQQQRDALVAQVMHTRQLAHRDQLYEHFLLDPGLEPAVHTSRLRQAIASVQLFIQRVLLNLVPEVDPSTLDASRWRWMKRYRVWEANRKIFLYPENWLEPELRDDKTHLFTELESRLLEGEITQELAEDAFYRYLEQLDAIARLEIVSFYCEEDALEDSADRLHVLGRTYSHPQRYFYRRHAHGMWTPWQPVSADVEGDHAALVVFRQRLYLFWVTMFVLPQEDPKKPQRSAPVDEMTFDQLMSSLDGGKAGKTVEIRFNRSERYQGQWTDAESSEAGRVTGLSADFDPRTVSLDVTREIRNGEERAVVLHLGAPIQRKLRIAGRNQRPWVAAGAETAKTPYDKTVTRKRGTLHEGKDGLKVTLVARIVTPNEEYFEPEPQIFPDTLSILDERTPFSIVPCVGLSQAANPELAALSEPFFFQDTDHTFLVTGRLKQWTSENWRTMPLIGDRLPWELIDPDDLVRARHPRRLDPDQPQWTDRGDWLTERLTAIRYGGSLVGESGRLPLPAVPEPAESDPPWVLPVIGGPVGDDFRDVDFWSADAQADERLDVVDGGGLNADLIERIRGRLGRGGLGR